MSENREKEFACAMRPADKEGHPDLCCCKSIDDEGGFEDLCIQASVPADDCGCCC